MSDKEINDFASVLVTRVYVTDINDWPAFNELSMLVRAEESADWSDELTVPSETSF